MRTNHAAKPAWLLAVLLPLTAACTADRATDPGPLPVEPSATVARGVPSEHGFSKVPADPPFYARIERPYVAPNDGEHAAIVFYRSPECVRTDFNLLDLLDIPSAFSCPMRTSGTEWYQDDAPPFMPPYLSVLRQGPRVPVWIVRWDELSQAAADDVLTIGELTALPSLQRGNASHFYEWLEPFPTRDPSRTILEASGSLANGRRFKLAYREDDFAITYFRLRIF